MYRIFLPLLSIIALISCTPKESHIGQTSVTKWQDGKKGAVSITWDDGTINQFTQALPIMNELGFKGTFFIITGDIPGSEYNRKFVGRPLADIMKEARTKPTDSTNLFERASAVRFLPIRNPVSFHTRAGELIERDRVAEACHVIDSAFQLARGKATFLPNPSPGSQNANHVTWAQIEAFAGQGHEFASHTVTHPRLSVMDEANIQYELEKSKEEILERLGPRHTFSAECPYGTEYPRVMDYALKVYPALRNRMPEPFLAELNRGSKGQPGGSDKEYVQWQRGPVTATPLDLMRSWVDTVLAHNNIWLVLVFHGVDSVGWEAIPHQEHREYFNYLKQHEDSLWVATFGDVTRYMRERMNATIDSKQGEEIISVVVTTTLGKSQYDLPLTLKTYVDSDWKQVSMSQGQNQQTLEPGADKEGHYVLYRALANGEPVQLSAE